MVDRQYRDELLDASFEAVRLELENTEKDLEKLEERAEKLRAARKALAELPEKERLPDLVRASPSGRSASPDGGSPGHGLASYDQPPGSSTWGRARSARAPATCVLPALPYDSEEILLRISASYSEKYLPITAISKRPRIASFGSRSSRNRNDSFSSRSAVAPPP